MNFKINKQKFHNALTFAARAISSNSPVPILSGILLEVYNDQIVITASDATLSIRINLSNTMDENLNLTVIDEGTIVIDARYLLDIVKKIDSEEISIEILDGTLTHFSGEKAEFRINGIMIIGDGDGKDSIASSVRTGDQHTDMPSPVEDISAYDIFIRKTGKGILSIDAPVSDYDGQWFIEEGTLVFTYDQGGNLDGRVTISGGQLSMDDPYTFKELTFRLDKPNERPFIRNLFNLTGGSFIIDAANAEDGTYPLADGTDSFIRTFTLRDDASGGSSDTKLSVGQTVTVGGSNYTLSLNGGTLSLTKTAVRE